MIYKKHFLYVTLPIIIIGISIIIYFPQPIGGYIASLFSFLNFGALLLWHYLHKRKAKRD